MGSASSTASGLVLHLSHMSERILIANGTLVNLDRVRNKEITREQVEDILQRALDDLCRDQPNILDATAETAQTEWNLVYQLAPLIHKSLDFLDCEIDVIKKRFGMMRPDVIFHHKRTNVFNFLVIEAKTNKGPKAIANEIQKIRNNWFQPPLSYRFGAVINFGPTRTDCLIEVIVNINS